MAATSTNSDVGETISSATSNGTIRSHSNNHEHHPSDTTLLSTSPGSTSTLSPASPASPASPCASLPSPPDSPPRSPCTGSGAVSETETDSASVSSLPSLSSSFFFSSAAASPPHPSRSSSSSGHCRHSHGPGGAIDDSLVIPSLTLPAALKRPTHFGKTLGDLRLVVPHPCGGELAAALLDGNEDVVECGAWEDFEGAGSAEGRVLRASTDWIEHRDAHGLERFEGSRNVEVVEVPGSEDTRTLLQSIRDVVEAPFEALQDVLNPTQDASSLLANLLASPNTPLYTALVLPLSTPFTPDETNLLTALGALIPIIPLHSHPSASSKKNLSSLLAPAPLTAPSAHILFRTPDALASLRSDAADRFLRWRATRGALADFSSRGKGKGRTGSAFDKAKWEAELSHDVARELRRQTTYTRASAPRESSQYTDPDVTVQLGLGWSCVGSDPLHFPSLVMLSFGLLDPLAVRVKEWVGRWALGWACVGVGVGIGIGVWLR